MKLFLFSQFRSRSILIATFIGAVVAFACSSVFAQESAPSTKVEKCWEFNRSDGSVRAVAADDTFVYASGANGRLIAISKEGVEEWSTELGGTIVSNIRNIGEKIFFVTANVVEEVPVDNTHRMRSLSRRTGIPLGSLDLKGTGEHWLTSSEDNMVAIAASGDVSSFNADLVPGWNFAINGSIDIAPIDYNGSLTVASADQTVRVISFKNGDTLSRLTGRSVPTAVALDGNGSLFVGDGRGRISRLNAVSGDVSWTFKSGGRVESVQVVRDSLVAASVDNFLYSISVNKGSVIWKNRLPGRISGSPIIGDKYIVLSVVGASEIFVFEKETGRVVDQIAFKDEATNQGPPVLYDGDSFAVSRGGTILSYRMGKCKEE